MPALKPKNKISSANAKLLITDQIRQTMMSEDLSDPVAKQYLPSDEENIIDLKENADPIGDHIHSPIKGIVHRHKDRVLLKITDTCAVYCRFCFRKDMVGKGQGVLSDVEIDNVISYLQNHPEIKEVILSGGDPLTLSNRRLSRLMGSLNAIEHLDIIRFHTRTPIVSPQRVDDALLAIINSSSKAIYMVLHINNAQEINVQITKMLSKLNQTKAVLLSQSVLLKNINDNVEALSNLFRALVKNSVKPYYLHHPDLATGTKHFRVSIAEGQALMKKLNAMLSGLCLPTYVLDVPGGFGKVPIHHCYVEGLNENGYTIEDHQGQKHHYEDVL